MIMIAIPIYVSIYLPNVNNLNDGIRANDMVSLTLFCVVYHCLILNIE